MASLCSLPEDVFPTPTVLWECAGSFPFLPAMLLNVSSHSQLVTETLFQKHDFRTFAPTRRKALGLAQGLWPSFTYPWVSEGTG